MSFIQHSSTKSPNKHHVYFPQLDQQSQGRIKPINQRRSNIDSFYISGFIHQEHNQLSTSKKTRGHGGKGSAVTSGRNEGHRTKARRNDLTLMMKTSPYLRKKSQVDRKGKLKVRSRLIEKYFITMRNEMEASITIQLFWRRILAVRRFHYIAERTYAAIAIQAAFRGFLVRLRVKEYLEKMDRYARITQAMIRRRLDTKRWNQNLEIMQKNAILIQRNIRKFLAKCLMHNYSIHNAAMMIQMNYRTSTLRKKYIQRRRNNAAVKIQKVVRRILARQHVNEFSKEVNEASRSIQRCWRGRLARQRRSKLLLMRCLAEFRNRIIVLDSKIDYFENQLDKFLAKSHLGKVQSDIDETQKKCNQMKTKVENCERIVRELERSKTVMNPHEIEIGWDEEIERQLVREQQLKTTLQLDMMFNMKRKVYAYRRELDYINNKKMIFEYSINELRNERHALRERLHEYERQESKRNADLNYRKAIADEKRKWKIVPRTASGKPRKNGNHATRIIHSDHLNTRIDVLSNSQKKIIERIEQNLFVAQLECCSAIFEPINKFQNYTMN